MDRIEIRKYIVLIAAAPALSASLLLQSCKSSDEGAEGIASQREVLIQIGDSSLYLDEVVSRMPVGLAPEDSATMFNSIVDNWIENLLLTEVAAENVVDMERIDRLTADYRKQLIISEYRKRAKKESGKRVNDDQIRKYYDAHRDEMVLERPLIKGIYLKVSDKAARDGSLAAMMEHPTKESVDRLEKEGIKEAMQYEYFMDKWIDFQSIAGQIPYRFFDPDAFVESTPNFTTSYNGATYMLHISEYLHSGEEIPFEFAQSKIREILTREESTDADRNLLNSLYRRALKEGKMKMVKYDPVKHEMR